MKARSAAFKACCLPALALRTAIDKWNLGSRADIARRWAIEGEGIAYKSWLDVSADVTAGRLVVLMENHPGEGLPLSLVCPHRKQVSPAVSRLHASS
ncbi:hypothetical protein DJ564_19010 [Pseudomonas sp. 31-12]|nr:hypothetical protein DJ564_19010 [Pseudomonas sp. 31-12]